MATVADSIEDAIAALVVADSNFNDIAKVAVGFLYRVRSDWFPLCEIAVWEEEKVGEQTSDRDIIEYVGEVRFDVDLADAATVSGRTVTVTSSRTLRAYVQAARRLLRDPDNYTLGNLSGSYWAVRRVMVGRGVSYGVDSRSDRDSDFQLVGRVPFRVEVQETNT